MTSLILLTAEQADIVRGPSSVDPAAQIVPRPLMDGRYVLNAAILDAPAHAEHSALLASLPVEPLESIATFFYPDEDV